MLVDASTVPATDLYLIDGITIILASIGTSMISIRYEHTIVSSEPPGSVSFQVTGTGTGFTHVETSAPYTLLGDKRRGRKYTAWSPDAGVYELTVTAFAGNGEVLNQIITTLTIAEGPVSSQILSTGADPQLSQKSSTKLEDWLLPVLVVLAVVVTIATVVVQRRRSQRSSALELDWDDRHEYADCGTSVDHTGRVDPASKKDAELEWETIA